MSTGYSGGTVVEGVAGLSTAGSVDTEAVSVPIGVAMLWCCGSAATAGVGAGASGSRGALYHVGNTGTAASCTKVATVGVAGPNRSPNGLVGTVVAVGT